MMTPQDKELCQEAILRQCNAASRIGMPEDRLLRGCTIQGFELDLPALERELRYLESKGFIREVGRALRPDRRHWATTAEGDEYLMRQGLI